MEELTLEECLQIVWNDAYREHIQYDDWNPEGCRRCGALTKMAKLFPISLAEQLDKLKESGRI